MNTPLLEVRDLRKTFTVHGERHVAVEGISFSMAPGSTLGIVGESGAGKSTVARIIVGLETPDSGDVHIEGDMRRYGRRHLKRERRRRASQIQMVFQDPYSSLDPRQRIGDAIAEVIALNSPLRGVAVQTRVDELLSQVGLSGRFAQLRPSALSGGQRQRVAIARALAAEPSLLVLDEAVSALDVSVQAQVLNLLHRIREETSIACLLISHDLAVVRHLCDDLIVMRKGAVVEAGRTATVLDAPSDEYTKVLVAATPRPGWDPTALPGLVEA